MTDWNQRELEARANLAFAKGLAIGALMGLCGIVLIVLWEVVYMIYFKP